MFGVQVLIWVPVAAKKKLSPELSGAQKNSVVITL